MGTHVATPRTMVVFNAVQRCTANAFYEGLFVGCDYYRARTRVIAEKGTASLCDEAHVGTRKGLPTICGSFVQTKSLARLSLTLSPGSTIKWVHHHPPPYLLGLLCVAEMPVLIRLLLNCDRSQLRPH